MGSTHWIDAGASREQVMRRLPDIGERFLELHDCFFRLPHIPAPVLELCRLRLAQLHDSAADLARHYEPVSAEKRDCLRNWASHPAFSDAERACLELTEVHAMDVGAITDAQADAVKAHYGEQGLVALVQALGTFDGYIRLGLLWQLDPEPRDGN